VDAFRFDILTRSVSGVSSRRTVLSGLLAAGGLGALRLPETIQAKKRPKKPKKRPTCRPGEQVGAVAVPGTGATVNTPVLKQGRRYLLRASGFWASNATRGQDAFADFEFADHGNRETNAGGVRLGLAVNGGSPNEWGSYTPTHVYTREVTGQGAALALRCNDLVHSDNSGIVMVEVLCV
jgi:hypothetical protein